MLQQIFVISPLGPCVVDRCYEEFKMDPNLMSGFLAAVVPRMDQMGFTLDNIHAEMIGEDAETYLEIRVVEDWICAAIATHQIDHRKVIDILLEIGKISHKQLGDPYGIAVHTMDKVEETENKIDLLLAKKGIKASSNFIGGKGVLPILNHVQEGKMVPREAATHLLDSIQEEDLDDEDLENIVTTLEFIDNIISKTNGKQLQDIQILIRSTSQGVSERIVRMDEELNF